MSVLNTANKIYIGGIAVDAVYLAGVKVWSAWSSPKDTPGLMTWIDPAQDVLGDGQVIATYVEHSNAQRSFVADPRPPYQPIFRAGAKPYLEFPNPSFGLTSTADFNVGMAGVTFLFVGTALAGTAGNAMMLVHGPEADSYEMRYDASNAREEVVVRYGTAGVYFVVPPYVNDGLPHLHMLRVTPTLSEGWTDAVRATGPGAPMYNTPQTQYVARRQGGYYFIGKVHEALVYAGALSDADLALLTSYLATKHTLYSLMQGE